MTTTTSRAQPQGRQGILLRVEDVAADDVTPGWRFVHIGLERDGILIDGIDIWDALWVATHKRIVVAHPQYPQQRHLMDIYRADVFGRALVFAAGEFSNGVWGFFVPESVT